MHKFNLAYNILNRKKNNNITMSIKKKVKIVYVKLLII